MYSKNYKTENAADTLLRRVKFRVVFVWIWAVIGGVITALTVFALLGFDYELFNERRYYNVLMELVAVGLIPVLMTFYYKEPPAWYGVQRKGLDMSILISILPIIVIAFNRFLQTGNPIPQGIGTYDLDFPWSILFIVLGIFAWGPLEVFFFCWLVENSDRLFDTQEALISNGLSVTTLVFIFFHILTTLDIMNAIFVGVIFLTLGLIFKHTRNSIGPMLAWTLINTQTWIVIQILLV